MDTTTDASTSAQGISVNTRSVGPVWFDGTVGGIKVNLSSSVTAGGFATGSTGTQTVELLEFRAN
jgi:hypothetical protein